MDHRYRYIIGCIILIALVHTAESTNEQVNSTSCLPIPNDCSFYRRCLEVNVPCGDDGYALAFGEHYCQRFKETNYRFSQPGQIWLNSVMYCLQEVLVPVANGQKVMSCPEIQTFAIASHYKCYMNPGGGYTICTIPRTDWFQLFIVIVRELNDPAIWELILEVTRTCGAR